MTEPTKHTSGDWIVQRGSIQGMRLCEYHDGKWIPVEESREDQFLGVFVDSEERIFDSPIYRAICVLPSENYPNAHLLAASKDLLEALQWCEMFYRRPDEDSNDTYERVAEVFYQETGYLRPGKDSALHGHEECQAAWDEWVSTKISAARAAIAKATQAQTRQTEDQP